MSPLEETIAEHLRGVTVGILTPFEEDGSINYEAFADNARSLSVRGASTFLVVANISEYHSLTTEEQTALVEMSVGALPDDACILGGVGGPTEEARNLARAYADAGVDVMMVMPPDHTYLHERGLIEYYHALGSATDRPLVPYVRGFDPSVEFLVDLTELESVVGIKYALEDTVKLGTAIEAGDDDVVWVDGLAEPYALSYWAEGVEGFTAGVSNFRPEVGLALYNALLADNWERARTIRNLCLPLQQMREETGQNNTIPGAISVPVVKKGLDLAGLQGGMVREPIRPLTSEEERRVTALYKKLDAGIENLVD